MTTRREFLKTTLAASAIAAIPAIAIAKETPVEFKPAPSNSLNDEILNAMHWRSPDIFNGFKHGGIIPHPIEHKTVPYYTGHTEFDYHMIMQKLEIQKAILETNNSFTITKEQAEKLGIKIDEIIKKKDI